MTHEFEYKKENEELIKELTGHPLSHHFTKYNNKLVYYISKLCGDKQMAEDLATLTFIKSVEKINTYHPNKGAFSTWLFTIGKNLYYTERKERKDLTSFDVEFDLQGTTMKEFIANSDVDECEELIIKKGRIMLKHMNELKEPYKEIMELRELDKMSYQDISNKLNENLNTVKSRIKNGRTLLINATKDEFTYLDKIYR
jgi:RNA polymerase sigma-70 factor (ECF subfamily)